MWGQFWRVAVIMRMALPLCLDGAVRYVMGSEECDFGFVGLDEITVC